MVTISCLWRLNQVIAMDLAKNKQSISRYCINAKQQQQAVRLYCWAVWADNRIVLTKLY